MGGNFNGKYIAGIPQDTVDRLRRLGVNARENEIFNIQSLTVVPPGTSGLTQGTSALGRGRMTGQLQTNQLPYGRPRRV